MKFVLAVFEDLTENCHMISALNDNSCFHERPSHNLMCSLVKIND